MKLIIYRGTNEIGGSCVELSNGRERIVFDVGLPLNAIDEDLDIGSYKPDISRLFDKESDVSAVFISHAHPDHYGLLSLINKDIPIYMSKAAAIILKRIVPLLGEENYKDLNIQKISNGEEVRIGDFIVRAHEVDHSAAAAMAAVFLRRSAAALVRVFEDIFQVLHIGCRNFAEFAFSIFFKKLQAVFVGNVFKVITDVAAGFVLPAADGYFIVSFGQKAEGESRLF